MKKSGFLILCFVFLIGASVQAKYYCKSADFDGTFEPSVSDDCDSWKNMGQGMYNSCLKAHKLGEKAFKAGKCELIVTKTYTSNGKECVKQVTKNSQKVISTSCVGR